MEQGGLLMRTEHPTNTPLVGTTKKVLIVDDSQFMRRWLRTVLTADPRLEIVGEASDAVEARDFLKTYKADVLTLDIEMPGMSGLEFLTRLMRARPMPVVMFSSLTSAGSDAAIQALSRGAIDCIHKPTGGVDERVTKNICERVYHAACTRAIGLANGDVAVRSVPNPTTKAEDGAGAPCRDGSLFLIGASTGGVTALETVLAWLHPEGSPVVIVQHMPGNFLKSFSERLQRQLPQNVGLAQEGVALNPGDIVLAPGIDRHTEIVRRSGEWHCRFVEDKDDSLHCPSVDTLFMSAVPMAKKVTAAILTGLGRDGAEGLLELSKAGATTFGQNEETSVVYGMPKAAKALGAVQKELPIEKIGNAIRNSRLRDTTVRNNVSEMNYR